MTNSCKRILVFNVNWLGDVLFTTPAIRALRKNYPDSYIACIAPQRCAQLLQDNPSINEFISFDQQNGLKGILSSMRLILSLKKKQFDIVFLFHRSFTRLLICFLAGIRNRVGYKRVKNNLLLTQKVDAVDRDSVHRVDYFLNIIVSFTGKVIDKSYELKVNDADIKSVENILHNNHKINSKKLVVFHPGANWPLKRWPVSHFAKLNSFLSRESDCRVVIAGSKEDRVLADKIMDLSQAEAIVLTGKLSLKQLAALFKLSDMVVSADSGPMHIAIAVGTPVIALFGPTDYKITGPYDLKNNVVLRKDIDCSVPCFKLDCKNNTCMSKITPEEVFETIKTKLLMRP